MNDDILEWSNGIEGGVLVLRPEKRMIRTTSEIASYVRLNYQQHSLDSLEVLGSVALFLAIREFGRGPSGSVLHRSDKALRSTSWWALRRTMRDWGLGWKRCEAIWLHIGPQTIRNLCSKRLSSSQRNWARPTMRAEPSMAYQYDAASRLTAKVYPDRSVLHVAYDGSGRPVGITDPTGDTTRYVYDAAGRRVQTRSTASSLRSELAYDAVGRLDAIESYRSDGTARPLQRYRPYDDAGNRFAMENEQGTTAYSYDELHRLKSALPPAQGAEHYDYDRAGNRLHSGAQDAGGAWTAPYQSFGYQTGVLGATHRVGTVTDEQGFSLDSFSYDANGNANVWVHGGNRALRWDTLDRLTAISDTFSGRYVYDPLGRRIEKTEGGETVRYQYDGLDVVAEYSVAPGGESTLAATYIFGPGIDEPLKIRRGQTLAAYHSDGLGSILAVSSIETSGSTDLLTYRYDAFGVIEIESSPGTLDSTYTYTGRELDQSGLYYYRARYYLASAGRFLSPCPGTPSLPH